MNHDDNTTSRAGMIQKLAMAPIALGAFAALRAEAEADATMDPKTAAYQTTPKSGAQCSTCSLYIPGKSMSANGTCKLVKGAISPKGWCKFYAKKA